MQHHRKQHKCLFYRYIMDALPGHVRDQTRYNLCNKDDIFSPRTTKYWNNLDESIRSNESKSGLKAKLSKGIAHVPPYYYSGRRKINITLARIRMHCSELHQHLTDMHNIKNNLCAWGESETSEHVFFTCLLYQDVSCARFICNSKWSLSV